MTEHLDTSQAAGAAARAELPPLIDREIFFGDPQVAYAALSPDGRFVSFVRPLNGVMNVWVKGIEEPFEAARPVTCDTVRPVVNYFWSADGRYILYAQDRGGDENFRVHAVDPGAPPAPGARAPAARDLTPYEEVQAQIYAVPKHTPHRILVGLNDRDPRLHDVYRLDLETGERTLVLRNEHEVAGWMADLEGTLRLGVRMTPEGGTELLRVQDGELVRIFLCTPEESCNPIRFHRDGRRFYLETNQGEPDLTRLLLFDIESGESEVVESDPESEVDFGEAIFSEATDELIATSYSGDRVRLYPRDPQFARDVEAVRESLPEGDLVFRSSTHDDRLWIVKNVRDSDEGPNYLYDRVTGRVELLYRPRPEIPTQHMAPRQAVRYAARDGLEIPAYLTLPVGVEPRGLPAILLPHGGPWARDSWGFSAHAQFLANRGYAVLQPNFRGSTGFGKRFLNLANGQWGTGTMQHDLTDGARWLVEQGIADAARIGIMGGSYGGYATLAGVAFTPEVYAAGVSIVGPSSILTLLNSIPPYWEPMKRIFSVRVGDLENPEDAERLRAQSPLYAAERILAPLLVIQGANDPRVKRPESDQIVVALRDLGRTVEYLVAPDEGHGFLRHENNLAVFAAIERFLAEHLGGRYQADMPPAISERLELLTVDVGSLTMGNEG